MIGQTRTFLLRLGDPFKTIPWNLLRVHQSVKFFSTTIIGVPREIVEDLIPPRNALIPFKSHSHTANRNHKCFQYNFGFCQELQPPPQKLLRYAYDYDGNVLHNATELLHTTTEFMKRTAEHDGKKVIHYNGKFECFDDE